MNLKKLKQLEKEFLEKYPGGFKNPFFADIEKKHKVTKMTEMAREVFAPEKFKNPVVVVDSLSKLISRSSMVSVFEKPKFRDFVHSLSAPDKKRLATGLEKFLLTKQQKEGFELMLDVLVKGKMAKWSLISAPGAYLHPHHEVFIKPTTVKSVIAALELENLEYKARPSWEFYQEYRKQINAMKKHISKDLSPSNAAFSGFLMMSTSWF